VRRPPSFSLRFDEFAYVHVQTCAALPSQFEISEDRVDGSVELSARCPVCGERFDDVVDSRQLQDWVTGIQALSGPDADRAVAAQIGAARQRMAN